jgi:hypothetical protein
LTKGVGWYCKFVVDLIDLKKKKKKEKKERKKEEEEVKMFCMKK